MGGKRQLESLTEDELPIVKQRIRALSPRELTQSDIAKICDVSQAEISRFLRKVGIQHDHFYQICRGINYERARAKQDKDSHSDLEKYREALNKACESFPWDTFAHKTTIESASEVKVLEQRKPDAKVLGKPKEEKPEEDRSDEEGAWERKPPPLFEDTLAKALEEKSKVLVLAVPGAGKSTQTRKLTRRLLTSSPNTTPVYLQARNWPIENGLPIPLRQLVSSGRFTTVDLMASGNFRETGFEDARGLGEWLWNSKSKEKPLVIILDGLDESPKWEEIVKSLNAYDSHHPDSPSLKIVVTLRLSHDSPNLFKENEFFRTTLQDLTDEQIKEYSLRWFGSDRESYVRFEQGLFHNLARQALALARRPILLPMLLSLCFREEREISFPTSVNTLYHLLTQTLLTQKSRHIDDAALSSTDWTFRLEVLEELAFHSFFQSQHGYATKTQVQAAIQRVAQSNRWYPETYARTESTIEKIIKEITEDSGLIRPIRKRFINDDFAFYHQTIQEWLAARYLAKLWKQTRQSDAEPLNEELALWAKWFPAKRNPIRDTPEFWERERAEGELNWLECRSESEFVPEFSKLATHPDYRELFLLTVGELVPDGRSDTVGQEVEWDLIQDLTEQPEMYGLTLEAIARCKGEYESQVIALCLWAVHVRDEGQKTPLAVIGNARNPENAQSAIEELILIGKDTKYHLSVRRAAISSLKDIGDVSCLNELLSIARDVSDVSEVRREALSALQEIGNTSCLNDLLSIVRDNSDHSYTRESSVDSHIRHGAVKALEAIWKRERQVDNLLAMLRDASNVSEVRRAGANALEVIWQQEGQVDSLLSVARDNSDSSYVRRAAFSALKEIWKRAGEADNLLAIIRDASDAWHVHHAAFAALEEVGDTSCLNELISIARDSLNGLNIRCAAISTLAKVGDASCVEDLLSVFHSSTKVYELRRVAISALAKIGDASCVEDLLSVVRSVGKLSLVRSRGRDALEAIWKREGQVDNLLAIASNASEDLDVRRGAISALKEIGDSDCVPRLLSIANNSSEVSNTAFSALKEIWKREGRIDNLLSIVHNSSEDYEVRHAAMSALKEISNPSCMNDILSIARDTSDTSYTSFIRWMAVSALAKIGDASCLNDLLSIARDTSEDSQMCRAAIAALKGVLEKCAKEGGISDSATIGELAIAIRQMVFENDLNDSDIALFFLRQANDGWVPASPGAEMWQRYQYYFATGDDSRLPKSELPEAETFAGETGDYDLNQLLAEDTDET